MKIFNIFRKTVAPTVDLNKPAKIDADKIAVWLVTGCSSGLGAQLCEELLARGYKVVITARKLASIEHFVVRYPNSALVLELDVTSSEQASAVVQKGIAHFGKIDVLVNNAGISYFSSIEESDNQATKAVFETNFWGTINMVKAILPSLRQRQSGYIINFSSICGLAAYKGVTYYCASKFALEAYSEALADEVSTLGIKVMLVEPGIFRTTFSDKVNSSSIKLPEYKNIFKDAITYLEQKVEVHSGRGDPVRGMRLLVDVVEQENPPLRLLLGSDAIQTANYRLATLQAQVAECESLSITTDNDDS